MTQGITIVTKMESHDVYGGRAGDDGTNHVGNTLVGRRGWLGNPFTTDIFDRERAINLYQGVFLSRLEQDEFREAVEDLEGKRVACWCRTESEDEPACHLDVIDAYLRDELEV
jgi:hypothetical protein